MSISWYEEFVGHDWDRYSKIASKATCVGCVGIAAVSLFLGFSTVVSVWTLVSGALLAVWEFPFVYAIIPNFEAAKTFLLENVRLKFEESKAVLYAGLAVFAFFQATPCVVAGMMLAVTAVLMVFASINRRADAAAGAQSSTSSNESTHNSLLGAASKFGTFNA